jgi:hypothetical protein
LEETAVSWPLGSGRFLFVNCRISPDFSKSKVRVKYPARTFFVISRKEAINGRGWSPTRPLLTRCPAGSDRRGRIDGQELLAIPHHTAVSQQPPSHGRCWPCPTDGRGRWSPCPPAAPGGPQTAVNRRNSITLKDNSKRLLLGLVESGTAIAGGIDAQELLARCPTNGRIWPPSSNGRY